jgi:hypothetical protein
MNTPSRVMLLPLRFTYAGNHKFDERKRTYTEQQEGAMTTTLSKKSGKGLSHGVVSELTAYFHVRPGHEEELRAAVKRFKEKAQPKDTSVFERLGLRDMRHVIFDNGTRVMWSTSFESDWDPYIDDAIAIFGTDNWIDWLQHTVEFEPGMRNPTNAQVKAFLQSGQEQAATLFNALPNQTLPQIKKAIFLSRAFQQVLDDPDAAQALQQPALKPLLDQAAD